MPKFVFLAPTSCCGWCSSSPSTSGMRCARRLCGDLAHGVARHAAMSAAVVLCVFIAIALLDSIHFRPQLRSSPAPRPMRRSRMRRARSLCSTRCSPGPREAREKTYSVPLATLVLRRSRCWSTASGARFSAPQLRRRAPAGPRSATGRPNPSRARCGLSGGAVAAALLWLVVAVPARAIDAASRLASIAARSGARHRSAVARDAADRVADRCCSSAGSSRSGPPTTCSAPTRTGNDVLYQALKRCARRWSSAR